MSTVMMGEGVILFQKEKYQLIFENNSPLLACKMKKCLKFNVQSPMVLDRGLYTEYCIA